MKTPNPLLLSMIAAIALSLSAVPVALAGEPNTALFEKNKNKHTESRHVERGHPSQVMPHRDCAPGANQERECKHETTHEKDDHYIVLTH